MPAVPKASQRTDFAETAPLRSTELSMEPRITVAVGPRAGVWSLARV
jgi:hypothetical protein